MSDRPLIRSLTVPTLRTYLSRLPARSPLSHPVRHLLTVLTSNDEVVLDAATANAPITPPAREKADVEVLRVLDTKLHDPSVLVEHLEGLGISGKLSLNQLKVKQLKQLARDKNISLNGCMEKKEIVERLVASGAFSMPVSPMDASHMDPPSRHCCVCGVVERLLPRESSETKINRSPGVTGHGSNNVMVKLRKCSGCLKRLYCSAACKSYT